MLKISRKALPGVVIILAMILGAWTAPKASQQQQGSGSDESNHPQLPTKVDASMFVYKEGSVSKQLSGVLANVSNAQSRVDEISSYKVNMAAVTNDSQYDKQFVEDSLTSNTLELYTMVHTVNHVKDPNLRNLEVMMIAQHTADQQQIVQLAQKFGIDTASVDFTNASVYPETPAWDLGKRTEDLRSDYLDPLVEKSKQSYDDLVLSILDQEHTSDVQSEMAAERLVVNPELKSFAKHAADVTGLHLELMDVVHAYIQQYDEPPSTDFSQSYSSPFMITVGGRSNSNPSNSGGSTSGSSK